MEVVRRAKVPEAVGVPAVVVPGCRQAKNPAIHPIRRTALTEADLGENRDREAVPETIGVVAEAAAEALETGIGSGPVSQL